MKTRWGCRRSCWSQGKVDWPAASHVLIKRLTARTMLMFRNDLVSTRGPPSSPNFLYRSIFFPFPKVQRNSKRAPYFQAPPRLSYRSLLSATPRLCSYEPLISTVIPPSPQTFLLSENVLPPFFDGAKRWRGKSFHPLFNATRKFLLFPNNIPSRGISRSSPSFLSLFTFNDYITTRWFDEIKRRRQRIGNQACVNSSRTR